MSLLDISVSLGKKWVGFGSFLGVIAGPVVKRALASIGFGVVSYAAISMALNSALQAAKTAWAGLAGETLSLIQMAGVSTAASIIAGALVTRVALMTLKRLELK